MCGHSSGVKSDFVEQYTTLALDLLLNNELTNQSFENLCEKIENNHENKQKEYHELKLAYLAKCLELNLKPVLSAMRLEIRDPKCVQENHNIKEKNAKAVSGQSDSVIRGIEEERSLGEQVSNTKNSPSPVLSFNVIFSLNKSEHNQPGSTKNRIEL